jgi:oligopeptidase B
MSTLPENETLPSQQLPAAPVARRTPRITDIHGERIEDDYFWLRDKENPETAAYLEAENAYCDAFMKPTEGFQDRLYKEMLARIQETDLSVPYKDGAYFYYSRTEEGKQYSILCRKKGSLENEEQVLLDLNTLAEGHPFLSLGAFAVTDDGELLAYSTDVTGFREYTLVVKNLTTGNLLPLQIAKSGSITWASDNRTLFYTTEDEAKRAYRLWRHDLSEPDTHTLVYEETDEMFRVGVGRTRSRGYLLLASGSHTTSEYRFLSSSQPTGEWNLVAPREQDHEYDVDHHGDRFYIRTNDKGRNFRLVSAPVTWPARENWTEVVPHRPEVMLEGVDFFQSFYVLLEREDALPRLRIADLVSGHSHSMEFPEPVYSVYPEQNAEYDTRVYRYGYESLVTPRSVFDYDIDARTSTLKKQTPVKGGYEAAAYRSERLHAVATDGTRIPISIVYKLPFEKNGQRPLFLAAYGSYGFPYPVNFSSNRLSLLNRGVVFAIAHIRGGGDMGKAWHDQGRMMAKKNTFTDFIAAAEHLVREGYTRSDRLVIEGGSAGGLLMGAVANMRPDLFKAVISKVPFVDVLNTMLDASLPLTVGEYEEWGNPNEREAYDYIKSYCPYTNLRAQDYPTLLVKTSFNDSQVMYWEPAKYVARLRTLKTDRNPLLLKTNMAAGHGGASGRYDFLREVAFDYAFLLGQVGLGETG